MSAEYSASASASGSEYTLTDLTEAIAKKRTDRAHQNIKRST